MSGILLCAYMYVKYVCVMLVWVYCTAHSDSVKGLNVDNINEYLISGALDGCIKVGLSLSLAYSHIRLCCYICIYTEYVYMSV